MTVDERTLENQHRALLKRGFRHDDPLLHQCPACGQQKVAKYVLAGKTGGRDIDLCHACGVARSWTRRPLPEDRVEDVGFDLVAFLR